MNNNNYTITGSVHHVGPVEFFGTNGFSKRELVVEIEDGKYPQHISLEFHKDKASLLDGFAVGQVVTVDFNLRGRQAPTGRYFTNLVGWKITNAGAPPQAAAAQPYPGQQQAAQPVDAVAAAPAAGEEVPF